ncbi:MAG: TIGR00341 family protein [Candidatus Pacebacteria bacterium]|nr:TIGR00341 family protein [Candidatus Paceibacterota bacterium]
MSFVNIFKIKKQEKNNIIKKLIKKSYPGSSFYIMIILASFIAALGLILDNLIIIIGSMLVAPLLYPIIFLGMSIVLHNFKVITRTLIILTKIITLGVFIGFLSAILFNTFFQTQETGIFQEFSILPLFYIAICSGLAASLAITRKQMEEFLPGVAVSIALLPPLINTGINLGLGHFSIALYSFQIFLINVFGIIFASITIFALMGFEAEKKTAVQGIKDEKKSLEKGCPDFEEKK